jgi:uncharacterized protein (TIGR00288 family)
VGSDLAHVRTEGGLCEDTKDLLAIEQPHLADRQARRLLEQDRGQAGRRHRPHLHGDGGPSGGDAEHGGVHVVDRPQPVDRRRLRLTDEGGPDRQKVPIQREAPHQGPVDGQPHRRHAEQDSPVHVRLEARGEARRRTQADIMNPGEGVGMGPPCSTGAGTTLEAGGTERMSDDRKLAMFMDFENIVRGVKEAQYKQFEIKLVLERLVEKGKIMVKRAYADWNRYAEYKRPFHEHAIELIDVPQSRYSGKNSADIRMVVDAMDLAYAKQHVDSFALVSGDSDFSPLVSKLRENDRYVIGLGVKSSSSELLVGNCDEFIFYEDLIRESKKTTALRGLPEKKAEAFEQLIEAIQALQRENKDTLWGSMVKQTMIRKNPAFNESYYGYSTFSKLLEEAAKQKILTLERDAKSGTYIITSIESDRAA